jgi:hypothetical protein
MAEGVKGKHITLNITQKLELIGKLESCVSVARACELYRMKYTVSDSHKNKEKLIQFLLKYSLDKAQRVVSW